MILDQATRSPWGRLRFQLLGLIVAAGLLPYGIRLWLLVPGELVSLANQTLFFGLAAVCSGFWLYRSVRSYPGVEDSSYILSSVSASFAAVLLIIVFFRLEYSRGLLAGQYVAALIWLYLIYFKLQRSSRIVIGVLPYKGMGALPVFSRVEWVTFSDLQGSTANINAITTDLRSDLPDEWERKLADFALSGLRVYHLKHLLESLTGRVELEHLSENSFGTLTPLSAYMTIKHSLDWTLAAACLLILSPLLLLIGFLVRMESRGPAIFRQRRIGYQGKSFTVYKFRTMTVAEPNESSALDAAITRTGDARVTRLGRFLRVSRLDELPQVWNILRGEMSWIGPRPEAEVLSRWYEAELPFYRYRHIVRPGITGWAQVIQGHVADLDDVRSKLHYDFYYIKNFSASCDLLIVARTIRTMLTGYGAK